MGIGEEGQIDSTIGVEYSRTRIVMLSIIQEKTSSKLFPGRYQFYSQDGCNHGRSPCFLQRRCFLWHGEDKVEITRKIVEGDYDPACPVSLFQNIIMFECMLMKEGSLLTRSSPMAYRPLRMDSEIHSKSGIMAVPES